MENIEKIEINSDGEFLRTYDELVKILTEKRYKVLSGVTANSFITREFQYWIKDDNNIEPNLVLVEILRNNAAIIYLEVDINELN